MPVEITATGSDSKVLEQVAEDAGYPITHQGSTRNRIEQVAADAGAGSVPWLSDAGAIVWLADALSGALLYDWLQASPGLVLSNNNMTVSYTTTGAAGGALYAMPENGPANGVAYDGQTQGQIRIDVIAPTVANLVDATSTYEIAPAVLTRAGDALPGPSISQESDGTWTIGFTGQGAIASGLAVPPSFITFDVAPGDSEITVAVEGVAPEVVAYVPGDLVVAIQVEEFEYAEPGKTIVAALSSTIPVVGAPE